MRSRLLALTLIAVIGLSGRASSQPQGFDTTVLRSKLDSGVSSQAITSADLSFAHCYGPEGPLAVPLARSLVAYSKKQQLYDLKAVIAKIAKAYFDNDCRTRWKELVDAVYVESRIAIVAQVHRPSAADLDRFVDAVRSQVPASTSAPTTTPTAAPAPALTAPKTQVPAKEQNKTPPQQSDSSGQEERDVWASRAPFLSPQNTARLALINLLLIVSLVVAAVYQMHRQRRKDAVVPLTQFVGEPQIYAAPVAKVEAALTSHKQVVNELSVRLAKLESTFESLTVAVNRLVDQPPPQRDAPNDGRLARRLEPELAALKARVKKLESATEPAPVAPPARPVQAPVDIEREILRDAWTQFEKCPVGTELKAVRNEGWQQITGPLLTDLPRLVPDSLKARLRDVLEAPRDYYQLTTKLEFILTLLRGGAKDLSSTAQEIRRLRELSQLLNMVQSSNLLADRLRFDLASWISDQFVDFSDRLLQIYQEAQREGKQADLEPAVRIVRQVLNAARLSPIEVALGTTAFDSTRHVGRATVRDPNYSDGVILGVLRNGFLHDGGEVVRQPEVIVNRVR